MDIWIGKEFRVVDGGKKLQIWPSADRPGELFMAITSMAINSPEIAGFYLTAEIVDSLKKYMDNFFKTENIKPIQNLNKKVIEAVMGEQHEKR